jgi:hypothetical protein
MNEIAIRDLAEVTELDEKVMSSTVGGSAGSANSYHPLLPYVSSYFSIFEDNDAQHVTQTQVGFGGGSVQQAMSAYLSA